MEFSTWRVTLKETCPRYYWRDVLGTRAFRTLAFRVGHLLAFMQFVETDALDRRRVEKQVFVAARVDEPEALGDQLLDSAFCHFRVSCSDDLTPDCRQRHLQRVYPVREAIRKVPKDKVAAYAGFLGDSDLSCLPQQKPRASRSRILSAVTFPPRSSGAGWRPPSPQCRVQLVLARNIAMAVLLLERFQIVKALFPGTGMLFSFLAQRIRGRQGGASFPAKASHASSHSGR